MCDFVVEYFNCTRMCVYIYIYTFGTQLDKQICAARTTLTTNAQATLSNVKGSTKGIFVA